MSKLWDYFKSLFHTAEQSSAAAPLIHELIERTEEEKAAYEHWKNTLVRRRLCNWLNDQYATYLVDGEQSDEAIYFLETPSARGFVIFFRQTQYSRQDCNCFFDYLKERVLTLNYRSYVSDTRTYTNAEWVENLQRHYLKPPIRKQLQTLETGPIQNALEQAYGNITIELTSRNDQVWNLKFSAVGYQDRMYQKVGNFGELMGKLMTES